MPPLGIFGVTISPAGAVLATFPIVPHSCPTNLAIAFDGSNYLVVFEGTATRQITGVRVNPTGQVLDGPDGRKNETGGVAAPRSSGEP